MFIKRVGSGLGSLSTQAFLAHFMQFGLPATSARAEALAAEAVAEAEEPRFLIYWFVEGGWMGYDMFNPVVTPNNVVTRGPDVSKERYRVLKFGEDPFRIQTHGNIRYGYLAEDGKDLFPDMAVLSSMETGAFHSGERLKAHYGHYTYRLTDERGEDERTVMQAFAEAKGKPFVLPHLSWHLWLSDGELNENQYTGRRGYYHALGPSHAHTIYAGPPERLRAFMRRMRGMSTDAVNQRIQGFVRDMDGMLLDDATGEAAQSYKSAREIYLSLANRGLELDPNLLENFFVSPALKEEFKVKPADELITYRSVNGNKARTKNTPAVNTQAMMTFELMRAGYSCAFWIEPRGIRDFDHHFGRQGLWRPDGTPVGQIDTTSKMREELWDPLKALVARLRSTQYKDTGKSLYDLTTIVLTSEFGRSIHGDVDAIKTMPIPETEKQKLIQAQDVSQHWKVTSAAFLGGSVKGDAQYGGVGERTLMPIPILPDGAMDPAYDSVTGELREGQRRSDKSILPDHGDVYATALRLTGLNPAGRGRNQRGPLEFIGKA